MGEEIDTRVGALAARQHGIVTFAQLEALGVGKNAVARRLRRGRLYRIHRGVYSVGHFGLDEEARWMAAVLACGEGAVLSHGSAAVLWALLRPMRGAIDVTVPTTNGRLAPRGVRLHRSRTLARPGMATRRRGIPVTTPARTVADLPRTLDARLARRARRQAEVTGLARLDPVDPSHRTRSDLEDAFLSFCRGRGLPAYEVNARAAGHTVDCLWPEQGLVVELDDIAYHRGDVSFEDDHALEQDLALAGYRFARVTGRQIDREPERLALRLRRALGVGSSR